MSWLRRSMVVVAGIGMLLAPAATTTAAAASPATECSATFLQGDRRLGPETLPKQGLLGFELAGYRRTGGLTPQQLLATYYDQAAGSWRYPPSDGYLIGPDGRPLVTTSQLVTGQYIDRFGSEYGQFLAPLGSSYGSRSIPPQSLVSTPAAYCNYRAYRILKPFAVASGPIAPWFAQPGFGWQYQLKTALVPGAPTPLNVKWLLDNGYLQRVIGPPQALAEHNLPPLDRPLS